MRDLILKNSRLSEKERRNLGILDAIRRGKEISRAEISKLTDLNIVTVSNYVGKYVKNKIVFETGLDISTGGRRPELLKLNPAYGYSIGIDLGAPQLTVDTGVVGVLMDFSGKVIAKEIVKKEAESFDKLSERVMNLTDTLVKKSGIPESAIKGVGVGIWGVIDRYRAMVRYAIEDEQIVSYANFVGQMESRYNVPVLIEHDSTLAAFGERWSGFGAGTAAENLIFLCSDSSCGLVIKGELYYGASKSAGELNINPPYPGEEAGDNCWASYDYGCCLRSRGIDLGISAKVKDYLENNPDEASIIRELVDNKLENITFNIVARAAEKNDQVGEKFLAEAGNYLGVKIASLINLFNPEVVVIGRGIEAGGDKFFSAIRTAVRKWGYEETVKAVKILPTGLGEDVVAVGAGGLIIQNLFTQI